MTRAAIFVALCLASCGRGTRTVHLDKTNACPAVEEATQAQIYAVLGRGCGDCACGGCVTACNPGDGSCLVACPGGFCDVDDLADGISLLPAASGEYAVIFQYVSTGADGVPHIVGGACAQVSLQSDGTESSDVIAEVECCAP